MSFDNWKSQASGVISWKDAELGYDAGVTDHQAEMSTPQGRETCKREPPHEKRYIGMRFACGCEQTYSMIGTEIGYDAYCRTHDRPTRRYCALCRAHAEGRDEGLVEAAKEQCWGCRTGKTLARYSDGTQEFYHVGRDGHFLMGCMAQIENRLRGAK